MTRSEKPCGTYYHPHEGQNCRCLKLCSNCGWLKSEHKTSAIATIVDIIAKHEGGWRNNGTGNATCFGCGYKGQLGEYHGTHVAKEITEKLGLS